MVSIPYNFAIERVRHKLIILLGWSEHIKCTYRNVIGMDHRVAGEDICPKHTHYNSACFVPTVPAPSPSPSSMLKDELVFVDLLLLAQESLNMIEEHLVHLKDIKK